MLIKIKEIVVDAVFPHICICGKWGEVLCGDCYAQIPTNKKELCPICLAISEYGQTCKTCRGKSQLTGVMVFGKHEVMLKDLVWRYKYEFIKDLSEVFTELLANKYEDFLSQKKFTMTFTPISPERYSWRGFNQAEELAQRLAERLDLSFLPLLSKEETEPQVGLKRKERIKNIRGKIFLADRNLNLQNKKILIIDDVYTTGSTLEECAKVLRQAGAREVWGVVISRE